MITGSVFQCSMLFSIPWSIAAVVDNDGRQKFDTFYKELLGGKIESSPVPKSVGKFEVPMPDAMSCYDVFFEVIIINNVYKLPQNFFVECTRLFTFYKRIIRGNSC